jgi:hypothetical protein
MHIEEPSEVQAQVLATLGYQVKGGSVLQLTS